MSELKIDREKWLAFISENVGLDFTAGGLSPSQLLKQGESDYALDVAIEEITRLHQELAECKALYNELIYEVASKFPGESRHKTARRYIRQMENRPCEGPCETERGV